MPEKPDGGKWSRRPAVVATVAVIAVFLVPLGALAATAPGGISTDQALLSSAAAPAPVPLPPGVRRADLAIALRSVPAAPAAGLPVTHVLDVTSQGPDPTRRTSVVDTLPPGLRFRSAAAPPGTRCAPDGSTVTCTGPGMRPGESRRIRVVAVVEGRAPDGLRPTSARVSSDLPDPVPGDGLAVGTMRVTRAADLAAEARPATAAAVPGTRVELGAAVINRGPNAADGAVIRVVVPPGLSVVSAEVPGGECTTGRTEVSCALAAPLAVAARATASVVATVDAAEVARTIAHTVTATSSTPDPRPGDATAVARSAVAPAAALESTTSGPAGLAAGGAGTWTTVVTNRGPSTARDVAVDVTADGAALTGVDVSPGTCAGEGAAGCSLGSLAPGESGRVRTTATVPADGPGGPVRLDARARSATPQTAAPQTAAPQTAAPQTAAPQTAAPGTVTVTGRDGGTEATAEVAEVADLAVAVSPGSPGPLGGAVDLAADFTLRARNLGPSDADAAVVTASVPSGLRLTTAPPGCVLEGARVTCRWPRLPAGGEVSAGLSTRRLPGVLPTLITGPQQLSATVSSGVRDPDPRNDVATASPVDPGTADLAFLADDADDADDADVPVTAGEVARRSVTVLNRGSAVARSVVLRDALAAGLTPVEVPPACRVGPGGTVCGLGDLPPGGSRTVALPALVDPTRPPGPLLRSSTVGPAGDPARGDPSPSDAVTSSTTTVEARADLRTTVTPDDVGPLLAGSPSSTYRVRATNTGPSAAPGTVLALDAPPEGVRVLGARVEGGRCAVRTGSAVCPVADLAPGETVEGLVTVAAPDDLPDAGAAVAATATSLVDDPTADDARAVATPTVTRAADLRTRIDGDPLVASTGEVTAGSRTALRVALTDVGPSTAAGATLSTTLSPGVRAVSATADRGGCVVREALVDCGVGDLPAGGVAVATIVVEPAPDAPGPLVARASASSATPGPVTPSTLVLRVVPPPAAPQSRLAAAEAAGLDPRFPAPTGPGEGLTIAARIGRLPADDTVALVLAGALLPAVLAGLVLRRTRSRSRAPRGRA